MAEPLDAYKVLQVDPEAEDEVVQAAYRRLARKYHPDLATQPEAAVRMAAINAAWAQIGKPAARAAYDLARRQGGTSEVASNRPASAPAPSQPQRAAAENPATAQPPVETVSRDWTSGRSTQGGGFDDSMRRAEGLGAAGPPPGRPSGSVLTFGRYSGWSIGEIARRDLEYIEWLDRMPIGRAYRDEIDAILRSAGRRCSTSAEATGRRGLFRRR